MVVGDGPERERLEALTRELGLAASVLFVGVLSDADRDAVYARSDVFVLTPVEPEDPEAIRGAIRRLADDSNERGRLAAGARAHAERFTWRRVGPEHVRLVRRFAREARVRRVRP